MYAKVFGLNLLWSELFCIFWKGFELNIEFCVLWYPYRIFEKDLILLIVQPIKAERSPQTGTVAANSICIGNFNFWIVFFELYFLLIISGRLWQILNDNSDDVNKFFYISACGLYCNLVLHAVPIITMTWQKSRGWVCLAPHSLAVCWWEKASCYLEMTLSFSPKKKTFKII
jgi:hypothetical protein